MADEYHYPPDLLELLVEALARLNKSKKQKKIKSFIIRKLI